MKIRMGFVSNSSSSSFLVAIPYFRKVKGKVMSITIPDEVIAYLKEHKCSIRKARKLLSYTVLKDTHKENIAIIKNQINWIVVGLNDNKGYNYNKRDKEFYKNKYGGCHEYGEMSFLTLAKLDKVFMEDKLADKYLKEFNERLSMCARWYNTKRYEKILSRSAKWYYDCMFLSNRSEYFFVAYTFTNETGDPTESALRQNAYEIFEYYSYIHFENS